MQVRKQSNMHQTDENQLMKAAEQAEIACNIVHWQLQLVANPAGDAGAVAAQAGAALLAWMHHV